MMRPGVPLISSTSRLRKLLVLLTVVLYVIFIFDIPLPIFFSREEVLTSNDKKKLAEKSTEPYNDYPTQYVQFRNLSVPYHVLIQPDLEQCSRPPKILIIILSMANSTEQRQAIRQTWANPLVSTGIENGTVLINFIISNPSSATELKNLQAEGFLFGDLVVTDLPEKYDLLNYKVYSLLNFHQKSCPNADFVMKIDEDVVLDVDKMLYFLRKDRSAKLASISCRVWVKAAPKRKPDSKWYMPYSLWGAKYYPTYCDGPLYLIGKEAVEKILDKAKNVLIFKMEDVLFTGIIAEKAKVPRIKWDKHLIHQNPELFRGQSQCETIKGRKISYYFGAHSLKGPENVEKGFKQLQNMTCVVPQRKQRPVRVKIKT